MLEVGLLAAAGINLIGSCFVLYGARMNRRTTAILSELIPRHETPSLYTALSVVKEDHDAPEE